MTNRSIELHDSIIERISCLDDSVVLIFSLVYIHQSEGKPGIDSGTVWGQKAEFAFLGGSISGHFEEYPFTLQGGMLKINNKVFNNDIPVPLNEVGSIELRLPAYSKDIIIRATKITVTLLGDAKYIEDFTVLD